MTKRQPRPARLALTAVKATVVTAIVVTGLASAPDAPVGRQPGYSGYSVADRPTRVERLMDTHECTVSGFEGGQLATSAIVRSARGKFRFVDVETGWEVYTRHGAAELVAVCLDEPPSA